MRRCRLRIDRVGLALALALAGAACGESRDRREPTVAPAEDHGGSPADTTEEVAADPEGGARDRPSEPPVEQDGEPAAEPTGTTRVEIWLTRGESPVAVERRVGGAPLRGALQALVEGPTPAETAAGLHSWFSDETANTLVSVRADTGHVVIDFRENLPRLIPSASSSAGSHQLLVSLDSTVFQFPEVRSVEYRLEGSCQAFWEWLQRGCEVVRRER